MRTNCNRTNSIFTSLGTLICASLLAACGTEICEKNTGPISEVKVSFKGFNLSQAHTLEIDSTVTGPTAPKAAGDYYSRRVSRMAFPDSARDGSATFIFEPGAYIMSLRETSGQPFSMVVWLRVFDATGLLLAEGRYGISGTTKQCWLNKGMTVNTSQTCSNKAEGEACASRGGQPYVCRLSGEALACETSTCGDAFVDSQNGEACDTADATDVPCGPNCLPRLVDRTLWEPGPKWYEVDTVAPPPRFLGKGAVVTPAAGPAMFVLFGGQDESYQPLGDTWLFDGETWAPWQGAEPQPPARFGHAMAYDPVREVVLLFGGSQDVTSNPTHALSLDDLWEFSLSSGWRQCSPSAPVPEARYGAAMAYHPGDGLVDPGFLLYGGYLGSTGGTPHPGRKTHHVAWDGAEYQYSILGSSTTSLPTALRHHTITWVPTLSEMLLVGGQSSESVSSSKYVYLFNGTEWVESSIDNQIPDLSRHQAVAVPGYNDLVLVGGSSSAEQLVGGDRYRALRALGNNSWASVLPSNVPPPRTGHVAFYLPGPDALFTFGGRIEIAPVAGSPLELANDTWLFHSEPPPPNPFLSAANLKIGIQHQTNVRGFYDLGRGNPEEASMDVVATMTLADLDGDGSDEIAMGFPGGTHAGEKIGNVLVDNPNQSDRTVTYTNALQVVVGMERAEDWPWGTWLGGGMGAGDFTGDGAADLVLGAATRQTDNATTDNTSGAIYVIRGGASGSISPDSSSTKPLQVATGIPASQHFAVHGETGAPSLGVPSDRFGYAVAVGDFDGDGRADIAVGAPERSESANPQTGAVYILSGAESGRWPTGAGPVAVNELDPAPLTLRSTTPGLRLGVSLAAGDVDGDGVIDLVVGSATTSGDATCDAATPACGAFAVLYGHQGLFGAGGRELAVEALSPSDGGLARAGDDAALFGLGGVVTVVDLDSDGKGEIVSALGRPDPLGGGPWAIAFFRGEGLPEALAGSASASGATHVVLKAPQGTAREGFGAFLSAGDVNGDRRADLLIGAPFEEMLPDDLPYSTMLHPVRNAGALYVVLGSRLASFWNPLGDGSTELGVDDLVAWADDRNVTFPLVRVRGSLAEGYLGTAVATSSHFSHSDPRAPRSHTLLFHPGWFLLDKESKYRDRYEGRVYTVNLQDMLR